MNTNKKYVMIVTSEDERYGRNGIQLDFFWDNPWEGRLEDVVFGDSYEELTLNGKYEGLFQQTYDIETGTRLSYGGIDDLTPKEEIEEWENKKEKNDLKVLRQGKYMLGRIKDIAAEIYHPNEGTVKIDDIDFKLCDTYNFDLTKNIDLKILCNKLECYWYGIKKINTGFDSFYNNVINLFADYYGGGCGVYSKLDFGDPINDIISTITKTIINTLSYKEGVITDDMFIVCEIKK